MEGGGGGVGGRWRAGVQYVWGWLVESLLNTMLDRVLDGVVAPPTSPEWMTLSAIRAILGGALYRYTSPSPTHQETGCGYK